MFISANFLAINYGVDDKIARFFADREPPADNLYWKDKLMYLRPEAGWLFIPLAIDLFYKTGMPREHLLSDDFVLTMEHIGHLSAQEEAGLITAEDALNTIALDLKEKNKNQSFFDNLVNYLNGGSDNFLTPLATPYRALHRGDLFLFSLAVFEFDDRLARGLVECWFALISSLLLLDDAEDIITDQKSGEPNAFLEAGLTTEGMENIRELVKRNLLRIAHVNKPMAASLDRKFINLSKKHELAHLLN